LLNPKVEDNIVAAFSAIHRLDVIHGDVRKENILVLEDESVRIIDFEAAIIEVDHVEWFSVENNEVSRMIKELKSGIHSNE